jgi:hypothetical protein
MILAPLPTNLYTLHHEYAQHNCSSQYQSSGPGRKLPLGPNGLM